MASALLPMHDYEGDEIDCVLSSLAEELEAAAAEAGLLAPEAADWITDCSLQAVSSPPLTISETSGERGCSSMSTAKEEEDLTCAICLDSVAPEDMAIVKGCDHLYCVGCILRWSLVKEAVTCPKCKTPFTHLYTYRALDGVLQDFPHEESVTLLRRAAWFEDALGSFKGKAIAFAYDEPQLENFIDPEEDMFDYEEDDDEYDDHLYMSSSGRRTRVMIGNRRWGSNGYIQSGRQTARPVQASRPSKAEVRAGHKDHDIKMEPGRDRRNGCSSRPGKGDELYGSSPPAACGNPSPSGGGRRARRAAKRAQVDVHDL